MTLVVHCILLFLIELIKLGLVMIGILNYKPKRKCLMVVLVSLGVLVGITFITQIISENANLYDNTYLYDIILFLVIIVANFTLQGRRVFLTSIISYVCISLIDMTLSGGTVLLLKVNVNEFANDYFINIATNAFNIIILSVIVFISRKVRTNLGDSIVKINRKYIVILLLGIIGCGLYIAPIQIFGLANQASKIKTLVALGVSLSGIVFISTCVVLVIINDSRNRYRDLSQMSEKLLEQQKAYYQALMEKNEATKRFRHDLNNHVFCMQHLCEQGKYNELAEYLQEIQNNMKLMKMEVQTGNEIVNMVVNDFYTKNNDHITFVWKGILPQGLKIIPIDLCTIFSNLISNAIEAVNKLADSNEKKIEIHIRTLEDNLVVDISNPVQEKVVIKNQRLVTTKKDKEQHGLGSINVEQCVKKYHGEMLYRCTEKMFTAEIIFPDIIM